MFAPGSFMPHALVARVEQSCWSSRSSPQTVLPLIRTLAPWLASGALIACTLGFGFGFLLAPLDARQGDVHRIIYIHVPATWMSVMIFMLMAFWAGLDLICKVRLAPMMVEALAPTGAMFAFMALWTGSLWGKPVWGAWWVWDMRLVADLALMLVYLAIVALHTAIEDARLADRIARLLVLLGVLIVPATLASVALWPATVHSPTAGLPESSGRASAVYVGLMAVAAVVLAYIHRPAAMRLRCVILERERQTDWVEQCVRDAG